MSLAESAASPTRQPTLDPLIDRVVSSPTRHGEQPQETTASVAFRTEQSARHPGRRGGYINSVLSIRVGAAVGSCATEPGELDDVELPEIAGSTVAELLEHDNRAVRVASLDAYLAHRVPHAEHPLGRRNRIEAGSSLEKSMTRARSVIDLLEPTEASNVAVIGVVNSLLAVLRERGIDYVPCDVKGGRTEWGEPVLTDHTEAVARCDAVLTSGMVLGNGSFEEISSACQRRGLPLVTFAQTGCAVFRELLGTQVTALSAEPYPFFWLTGDATDTYAYSAKGGAR